MLINKLDFSTEIYSRLLICLREQGYKFQRMEDYLTSPLPKVVILRHDVDLRKYAALRLAKVEASLGIKATYYFRIVKQSYSPEIIKKIAAMGHEIAYHYEDLATHNGDYDAAIEAFQKNLNLFRKFYPVKTICMHGSSGSRFDNRDLWKRYSLHDYGLIGEPYLSLDFDQVLYLSDTGRRWNGFKMSLRDKVETRFNYNFYSTHDIIREIDSLPAHILFTAHPEQWTDNIPEWLFVKLFSIAHTAYKVYYRNPKIEKREKSI